ncbi:NADPH:quinone oxidoreductase family protein [Sphingomonas sp.]|uniref:NADPH:quinone oxidoreductase family protein n=1 Tax=Sphingomonas sp. TaxID=28214 RepID=UPI0035C7F675
MRSLVVSSLSPDLSGTALAEVPEPEARDGEVLVRVRAAALNYPDLLMTRGEYQLKPPLPFTPGMEVAGEVIAGEGFAPGEAVVAGTRLGGFAEMVAVPAAAVRRKPAHLFFAEAASIGAAYLTAYVGLVRLGAAQPGEWVLVHGATGGVGLAAVDLAHALGCRVIATSRSLEKLRTVSELYHPEAIVPVPGFRDAVKDLTGGGAEVIYDPVGGDVFDESTRCIAFGGRLLVVGFTSGRIATLSTNIPLIKGFSVVGVRAGEYGRRFPERGRENNDAIWRLAEERKISPHVHAELPLDRWQEAFGRMRDSNMVGKLVLTP